jgi:hypothetical protein
MALDGGPGQHVRSGAFPLPLSSRPLAPVDVPLRAPKLPSQADARIRC